MLKVELRYSRHSSPRAPLNIDSLTIKYIHLYSGYLELTEISFTIHWTFIVLHFQI